jgi:hypothetical protein
VTFLTTEIVRVGRCDKAKRREFGKVEENVEGTEGIEGTTTHVKLKEGQIHPAVQLFTLNGNYDYPVCIFSHLRQRSKKQTHLFIQGYRCIHLVV